MNPYTDSKKKCTAGTSFFQEWSDRLIEHKMLTFEIFAL